MRARLILAALLLTGCGVYWNHAGPEVDAYEGPRLSDQEVAIIDHARGCFHCVELIRNAETGDVIYDKDDGNSEFYLGANKIRLRPGRYFFSINEREYKSKPDSAEGYVDLIAGRTYSVDAESCIGFPCFWSSKPDYTTFVWMEDTVTGEVVLGERY